VRTHIASIQLTVAPLQGGGIVASGWISILVDGQDMRAYASPPETTDKVPGVIIIMEAFGVNQHTQEVTATLAREGYVAAAPVFYLCFGL
jgi:dienelactone hydrolase